MWENRILYLDGEAIVLDKPAGLAVHPGPRTRESLEDFLHHLRFGFARDPRPVHRLDRDTSGCLLLARNPRAHRRFQRAFEEQRVAKSYVAVLDGIPEARDGVIDLALQKTSSVAQGWRIEPAADGQPAVTSWRLLSTIGPHALVRFEPKTGRTHQVRVHAAAGLAIPIAGDPLYGRGEGPMLLHALSLRLERDAKPAIEATAPLPLSFRQLGFDDAAP